MKKMKIFKIILASTIIFVSCNTDNDLVEIKSGIVGEPNYDIKTIDIPLEINNIKVNSVQTNGLSSYHLGQLTQGDFGTTNASIVSQLLLPFENPTFGTLSQSKEKSDSYDEEETIKNVYLYLPFFSKAINQNNTTTYTLDSIFGMQSATFNINVNELNYNLRSVNTSFDPQVYYSDQNTPTGEVLVSGASSRIDKTPIVRYQFDDPATTDDESKTEKDKLSPGIRIELTNKDFFQKYLLNKEGETALSNNQEFVKVVKGIIISTSNFSQEVLALINLFDAKIEVNYTYKNKVDGKEYLKTAVTELTLATQKASSSSVTRLGIAFNKFDFQNENVTMTNDNIYLKGGRYIAELTIPDDKIQELKSKNVLINQAELVFYVNETQVGSYKQPQYLLLYNAKTGGVLADYTNDLSTNTDKVITSLQKQQKDKNGTYYRTHINDHLISVLKSNAENVKLGLVASLRNTQSAMVSGKYKDNSKEEKTILGNSENILSTIIYGNGANVPENKKLKLRVKYSISK